MERFSDFHLSEKQFVNTKIPGKKSKELILQQERIEGAVVSYTKGIPIALKRGKGAILEDVDNNLFIDFFAGAGVLNLGHSNREVLEKVFEQEKELIHCLDLPTQNKLDAITKILNHLPVELQDKFKVSFGGPTGSDAVESAIKLAKIKTGRDTIISFTGGYHGMSNGALSLTSDVKFRKKFDTNMPNVHFAPYPYCYRCPFNKNENTCKLNCMSYLEQMIENTHSGIPLPAAIIIEPVQGEGGNIPAKAIYLERLISLAQKHGIMVIFDEIQSGFFRTGEFLSFMDTSAVPDIITFSKGMGGVGLPLAGLIYKKEIEAWGSGDHIGTFRCNQASLAGTNAAFDFVDKYQVADYTKEISEYLMNSLQELYQISSYVGNIRGKGLMIGIEIVKSKHSKTPFINFVKHFKKYCIERGLLFEIGGHYGNVIRLVPPLIITKQIVDNAVDILKEGFEHFEKVLNKKKLMSNIVV